MHRFLCAITFLTRLPLPVKKNPQREDFAASVNYFPLVGLVIGGLLGGSWFLFKMTFPAIINGALLLSLHVIITGGLHLDGFMDTLDGLLGGKEREERLNIMRDSRVGAFGVLGAFLLLLIKFSIYTQLNLDLLPILVLAPVLGRQVIVWALISYPYARQQGLGNLFNIYGDLRKFAVTTGMTLFISIIFFKIPGLAIFLLTGIFTFILAKSCDRLLGGLTGDTYGAFCELTEVFVLLIGFMLGGHTP
ncbi:MAG: adenosylcobinamide-GDP ribazoletransferase [Bacillota bacterium]|nr:adenosylcobinamide-GDP ribazoletransferase [Bacillota bacterium]